jgi:hypothetical protein
VAGYDIHQAVVCDPHAMVREDVDITPAVILVLPRGVMQTACPVFLQHAGSLGYHCHRGQGRRQRN